MTIKEIDGGYVVIKYKNNHVNIFEVTEEHRDGELQEFLKLIFTQQNYTPENVSAVPAILVQEL